MPKQITLTPGERVGAVKLLNEGRFTTAELEAILEDIKKLAMSDEDWKAANLSKTQNADGSETWRWDETMTKEIEINAPTAAFLHEAISKKGEKKELTLQDAALVSLAGKLA